MPVLAFAGAKQEESAMRQEIAILQDDTYRYIQSNGVPMHETGTFPNRDNPYAIKLQKHSFRIPLFPQESDELIPVGKNIFGIGVNGVPFDPNTTECWKESAKRGAAGPHKQDNCKWQRETIVKTKRKLGLDKHHAHVQPNGVYHYHGVPRALVSGHQKTTMIGYAADGYAIYALNWLDHKPSYRLKEGKRPVGAPRGKYDGTYMQDFEYVIGSGTLDECNGSYNEVSRQYRYYVTDLFPFVPRCWMGEPDSSFLRDDKPNKKSTPVHASDH